MPPPTTQEPPREGNRIAKLLARAGVASRREIERMIAEGRVAIDGKLVETPATILASLRGVTVDGNPVQAPAPARLFLYHKPSGLLVTERDPAGRPTIYDKLPSDLPRLVPVGRLDLNTEGLLLLTTDGELKRQLELPSTGVERAYRARAYGNVTQAQLEDLIEGVEIERVRYGSINANLERRTGANVWIEMILTEGKNREVRRVLEFLGLKVSRLIRIRYGPFLLGDLAPGEFGEVRQHDVVAFRRDPTRTPAPDHARAPSPRSRGERNAAPAKADHPYRAPKPGPDAADPRKAPRQPIAAIKPKRFYDAKEKGGVTPTKPVRAPVRNDTSSRARRTATDPRRKESELVDKPRSPASGARPARPARPGAGKPRPSRTRR
ncbi:pseudouridine synthase [Sphingomonas sp. 28-63-12]|uniref:pseudouridine synthase n=1 Tax=Sphingomonas sp. 28-63-12 TaxID=1970434 RepID=UPI000BC48312|nr:MAG: pseudouridine synthase [Sphingomonas sp. 28-63-12]